MSPLSDAGSRYTHLCIAGLLCRRVQHRPFHVGSQTKRSCSPLWKVPGLGPADGWNCSHGSLLLPYPHGHNSIFVPDCRESRLFFTASQPDAHWIHRASLKRPVLGPTLPLAVAMCSSCCRARAYVLECSLFPVSYK